MFNNVISIDPISTLKFILNGDFLPLEHMKNPCLPHINCKTMYNENVTIFYFNKIEKQVNTSNESN